MMGVQVWLMLAGYSALGPTAGEMARTRRFVAARFETSSAMTAAKEGMLVLANHEAVQRNGRDGRPLKIADTEYQRGLFCHAQSEIVVRLAEPGLRFSALVGVDGNTLKGTGLGSVEFAVRTGDREAYRSDVRREGMGALPVSVDLGAASEFVIEVDDAGDGISADQANWVDAKVVLSSRREVWLGDLPFLGQWGDADTRAPAFSFKYDGRPSSELLDMWQREHRAERLDDQKVEHVLTFSDPETGLVVRQVGVEYLDFPTVEWTVFLKNTGSDDTPVVSEIQGLDLGLERGSEGEFVLHHHTGGLSGPQDYEPLATELEPRAEKEFATWIGFPTAEHLPYFNVEMDGGGIIVGLGWPGAWKADFTRDGAIGLRVRGGQELTHLRLRPGEEVRTPLVVLQFWEGERVRSQNVWRRWMIAHNLPRPGGELPEPMMEGFYATLEHSNEKDVLLFIDRYLEEGLKPDYWWIDAGWYPYKGGDWQDLLGTWEVDRQRFPNGLRGVFDYAHARDIRSLVWFEPERVQPGSWLYENHPEWLLGPAGTSRLFNHGTPRRLHGWWTISIG